MKKSETKTKRGLQPYVDYLLQDIANAEGQESNREYKFTDETTLTDNFAEMERFVTEEPLNTFGQICGLSKEQFPPSEKLSKQQVRKIVKAFYNLLHSWNLDVVIPKKFPQENRYNFLVPLLDKKTHILKNGTSYIEFCEYEPKECPFGSWCDCKDFLEDKTESVQNNGTANSNSSSRTEGREERGEKKNSE